MTPTLTSPRAAGVAAGASAEQPAAGVAGGGGPVRWGWGRLIVATAARSVLALVWSLAVWGIVPVVLGWQPTTVMTGSMQPRIMIGDIAVAKPTATDQLRQGQLLLFPDPDHIGRLRLHRFVGADDAGQIITRGDANAADDSTHIEPDSVLGVAVLRVPHLGLPIVWWHEHRYGLVAATALSLAALLALSGLDHPLRRTLRTGTDGDETDPPALDVDATLTLIHPVVVGPAARPLLVPLLRAQHAAGHRVVGVVAGVTAAVLALALVLITPAWAAYSSQGATTTINLRAARYYACDSAPTADNPSLYWKLDETSGTVAADGSGNGRTGTYVNGFTNATAACGRGSAATLNGLTQYLTTTSTTAIAGPNTFTIEAWFKTGRGGMIASFGNARTGGSGQHDRKVYVSELGKVYFGVYPGSVKTVASGTGFADNRWHHVVATLSGNGMRLYVDGALVGSDTAVTTGESYNGFWRFGYDTPGGWTDAPLSGYLAGSLDNVAIYPTALTATQVADHYASR